MRVPCLSEIAHFFVANFRAAFRIVSGGRGEHPAKIAAARCPQLTRLRIASTGDPNIDGNYTTS
jgi:hypothetical protein